MLKDEIPAFLCFLQEDHEAQRRHNYELVRMQEESLIRQEKARQATEEQIQAQIRQTEKERASTEQETYRVKKMAEAIGKAREKKLSEEYDRQRLIEEMNGEKEKWLAAINTTFRHIEGQEIHILFIFCQWFILDAADYHFIFVYL